MNNNNMNSKDNVFGERLRTLRTLSPYKTQKEFAAALGMPQSTLSAYEGGKIKPTVDVLISIADEFNVSTDWLCGHDSKYRINSLGAVVESFFEMFETEDFNINAMINDAENGKTAYDSECVELKIFSNINKHNTKLSSGKGISDAIIDAYKLNQKLRRYEITQDTYEREKKYYIETMSEVPLSKIDHSGISDEEQRKKMLQYLKQELELMNNK